MRELSDSEGLNGGGLAGLEVRGQSKSRDVERDVQKENKQGKLGRSGVTVEAVEGGVIRRRKQQRNVLICEEELL